MLLGKTAEKLERLGVQTLAVVGSSAERVRLYLRYRPTRCLVGADPDLAIAPGLWRATRPGLARAVERRRVRQPSISPASCGCPWPRAAPSRRSDRLDGYQVTDGDQADFERHQAQFTAQFLVGRDGIVRWANVECARDGLAGIDQFPTDEEILAAARALAG